MPLAATEVAPGSVAILDVALLMTAQGTQYDKTAGTFRTGPFLCVQVQGDKALWVAITSQQDRRGMRLEIRETWRVDGSPAWRNTQQFLNDARTPFIGPPEALMPAFQRELPHHPHLRPKASDRGVAAVLKEIRRYRVPTL